MPPRNTAAVGSTIKYRIKKKPQIQHSSSDASSQENPVADFMLKLKLAWQIFFPEAPAGSDVKPKEEAKQRLRMILVADRCGMSPAGLTEMKRNILTAIEEFVDIDSEEQIDVSITTEPEVGGRARWRAAGTAADASASENECIACSCSQPWPGRHGLGRDAVLQKCGA